MEYCLCNKMEGFPSLTLNWKLDFFLYFVMVVLVKDHGAECSLNFENSFLIYKISKRYNNLTMALQSFHRDT